MNLIAKMRQTQRLRANRRDNTDIQGAEKSAPLVLRRFILKPKA